MKLYCVKGDYRTYKVAIAARYAGVNLEQKTDCAKDELKDVCTSLPLLEKAPGKYIFQSNAILRYVAGVNADSGLYGSGLYEMALVDQWLDYCWSEIELPSAVICGVSQCLGVHGTKGQKSDVEKRAMGDLQKALDRIEEHLGRRTFFVGERVTAADIAIACALMGPFRKAFDAKLRSKFVNTTRWFLTCVHQKEFKEIIPAFSFKDGEVSKDAPSGVCPAASGSCLQDKSSARSSGQDVCLTKDTGASLFKRDRVRIKEVLAAGEAIIGRQITVKGWCRTVREAGAGAFAFVEVNDGSCFSSLQVVVNKESTKGFEAIVAEAGAGACVGFVGNVVESPAKGQTVELQASEAFLYGGVDKKVYPMAKKRHTLEHLRSIAHLRPRSNIHGAAMRVRNAMAFATHKFFNEMGFLYIHTPLITASDCEGAGEMFSVTTLLPKDPKGQIPRTKTGEIDYSKDFFSRPAYLTVSGQLNVETHACALSDVYTFGPTFRAENSHTSRHLAEFWMIEPEICFAGLKETVDLAEDYVKYLTRFAMENCMEDLQFFDQRVEKGLIARLESAVQEPFERLDYTRAIEILTDPKVLQAAKFQIVPKWGDDLGSEHERYLTEKIFKKPVVVMNYPAGIKAFYMRMNEDGKTVAAADVLVPRIGELIGGSAREERYDHLARRCVEATGQPPEAFWWYLDLRKYGTVPHAGFGLGFERVLQYVTGIENIRDVIPFPRWPGNAEF